MAQELSDNIIFYDGDCGFCNRIVQFVLRNEKGSVIYFSALQSDFSVHFFESQQFPKPDLSTFYFYSNGKLYNRSKAAFRVIPFLKWYWKPLLVFSILPVSLSDRIYAFIARHRKKIGGNFCIIPSPENRSRFYN
jgi:predicted DCC family thiol-disulfide oxidoreductase YuxK